MQQVDSDSSGRLTLWKLPDELLIKVLRCLDIPSLKDARLTCRRWREAGAYGLFDRVYFAPRKDIMDIFATITSNPAFASNIRELVYDARLYWGHMTEYDMYARAYECGFPVEHPENDEPDHGEYEMGDLSIEEYNQERGYDQDDIGYISNSLNHTLITEIDSIQNLLSAARLHAPRLRELLLGSELSNLSAKAFTCPDSTEVLEKLVTELVLLKVDLIFPHHVSDTRSALPMADVLRKAQKLEHLYLDLFRYTGSPEDWKGFLLEVRWPRLRVLNLSEGDVDFITIKTLTHAHADVLRELSLRNVHLCGERGWEEVAQELRGPLKLNFVSLLSMFDDTSSRLYGSAYLSRARLNQAARQLIGWSRESDFGIANTEGAVMMWHKENYVHNPRLHLVDGDDDEDDDEDDDDDEEDGDDDFEEVADDDVGT